MGFGLGGRYSEEIVEIMSKCCADIAVAEFQQFDHINDLATTPDDYFQIVEGKTAGPLQQSCKAAALMLDAIHSKRKKCTNLDYNWGLLSNLLMTYLICTVMTDLVNLKELMSMKER